MKYLAIVLLFSACSDDPSAVMIKHNPDGSWFVPANSGLGPRVQDLRYMVTWDGVRCDQQRQNGQILGLLCRDKNASGVVCERGILDEKGVHYVESACPPQEN